MPSFGGFRPSSLPADFCDFFAPGTAAGQREVKPEWHLFTVYVYDTFNIIEGVFIGGSSRANVYFGLIDYRINCIGYPCTIAIQQKRGPFRSDFRGRGAAFRKTKSARLWSGIAPLNDCVCGIVLFVSYCCYVCESIMNKRCCQGAVHSAALWRTFFYILAAWNVSVDIITSFLEGKNGSSCV